MVNRILLKILFAVVDYVMEVLYILVSRNSDRITSIIVDAGDMTFSVYETIVSFIGSAIKAIVQVVPGVGTVAGPILIIDKLLRAFFIGVVDLLSVGEVLGKVVLSAIGNPKDFQRLFNKMKNVGKIVSELPKSPQITKHMDQFYKKIGDIQRSLATKNTALQEQLRNTSSSDQFPKKPFPLLRKNVKSAKKKKKGLVSRLKRAFTKKRKKKPRRKSRKRRRRRKRR